MTTWITRKACAVSLALAVGAATLVPWAAPTVYADSYNNDVEVRVRILDTTPTAEIVYPPEGLVTTALPGVFELQYSYVAAGYVYVQVPGDSTRYLIAEFTPSGDVAEVSIDWANSTDPAVRALYDANVNNFGVYTFSVDLVDKEGNRINNADQLTVDYLAVSTDIIPTDDGSFGDLRIYVATGVCKVGIQIYGIDDAAGDYPLLDPEYVIDDFSQYPTYPGYIELPIATIDGALDLTKDYRVATTAFDCSGNELGKDAEAVYGSEGPVSPPPEVPDTGELNVFGLTISMPDYIVSGVIAFGAVAIFATYAVYRRVHRKS